MATIAQVQSAAAAKREANSAPRISFTASTPTPTSSFTSSAIITPGKWAEILWQSAKYTDAWGTSYGSDAISRMNASGSNITSIRPSLSTITSTSSVPTSPVGTSDVRRPVVLSNEPSSMLPSDTGWLIADDEEERKRKNAQRLADIKLNREAKIKADAEARKKAEFDASPEGKLLNAQKKTWEDIQADLEAERKARQEALKPMNDLVTEFDKNITDLDNEVWTYERDQNELIKQYEGNRLNQVRWQLMSALAARGVDISKLTPEQILQLAGDVGSKAFTDVFQAKEKTKWNIDARRRDANIRIAALRQQKMLTDQQYKEKFAEIDAYANSQKRAVDDSYSKMFYNVMTTADQNKKAEQQTALANLLAVAKDAWLSGSALASVAKIANTSNSSPEALRAFYTSLANPSSLISQKIATAESDAKKSAIAQAALKQYEAETDRLKAEAAMKNASRVRYIPEVPDYGKVPPSWVSIGNPQK